MRKIAIVPSLLTLGNGHLWIRRHRPGKPDRQQEF